MSFRKRLVLAALALGLGMSHVAVQAQEAAPAAEGGALRDPEWVAAYEQGQQLLTEKKYKEAVAAFNQAIAVESAFPEALVGKGDALREMEDYASAVKAYSQALDIDVNSAAAYNGRGESFMELGQIDMASNDFSNALELAPNNAEVLSNIGHILINYAQDAVGAIRRLDDAIALNDQDARAYRDRAWAHILLREYDKAEADVRRSVEVDPADHETFFVMANIYLYQEKYDAAIQAISSAIEAYKPEQSGDPPVFIAGYLARADANLKLGETEKDAAKSRAAFEAAVADADAVLADYNDRFPEGGRAYYRKGRGLRMLQKYSDAVDAFTDAIQSVSAGQEIEYMADALMYRGICWFYMNEPDLARGDFEQASATGSGYQDPRVFLWIGFTHHKQGDYREAINSYNEAIAKSPSFALAYVNKGRAYMDLKEYERAVESFNDAIRTEPDVGDHYYNVGFAYMQMDQAEKAVNFLNLAVKRDNPQPKMFRLMATALRELGRTELAEQYERRANETGEGEQAAGE